MLNIKNLRREYRTQELDLKDINPNPFLQFEMWFQDCIKNQILEPNAMILATATNQGKPSSRTVLLKIVDEKGFSFFTNYQSRKAQELKENPFASITFIWLQIERQIVIEGRIEKLSKEESATYFATRPRTSQLGAWASKQDQIIPSRDTLEKEYIKYENKFKNQEIPLPPYWGGFRLIPSMFEFLQGRENRLHDRFRYLLRENVWVIERLAP